MRHDPRPGVLYATMYGRFRGEDAGIKPVPADMQPHVIGVYLGGCVAFGLGKLTLKHGHADAHAHTYPRDQHRGWVCFQHPDDLQDTALRMHELAHILSGEGHTDAWRATMQRLGQQIPPRYQKRRRKP